MLSFEDLPQSLRDNVVDVDFPFHPGGGSAMMVTFRNGLDASVITGPGSYGGNSNLFELAVGFSGEGVWEDCPLTESGGITGWLSETDLIDLLARVGEFSSPEIDARRRTRELQSLELLHTATQFGVLRLAGLGENDNPYDYLEAPDLGESLGLDLNSRQTLKYLADVYADAVEKLERKHLEELVAEDEARKS